MLSSLTRLAGLPLLLGVLWLAPAQLMATETELPESPQVRRVRLDECLFTALRQNRALQIERLEPAIAQSWLSGAYGYYDPVFRADLQAVDSRSPAGFDPDDFNTNPPFEAESDRVTSSLIGFLPSGLSYNLFGSYLHSEGLRNNTAFESHIMEAGLAVRQPLLRNFWIDQGRLTIKVNKKNLTITGLGVHYVAMDVINQVQHAYYELAYAIQQAHEQRNFLDSREQLLASVKRRIEMGTLTALDERLAAARVATVQASVAQADNAQQLAENELKLLLGAAWVDSNGVRLETADALLVIPQQFSLQESWQRGLASRPDLAQLREDVAKANLDLKYRRNQLFPALDLVASHTRKGDSDSSFNGTTTPGARASSARRQIADGDFPRDMVGVIFSVPLGLAAERANFRASKHLKAQAELRVKQYEELVMREISDALHTARSQFERVTLTRRARELSEAALEAESQKLTGGKSTIFLVLELQNDVTTARTAELRAKADYNRARSQLRFAEASLLEHWKVAIELK